MAVPSQPTWREPEAPLRERAGVRIIGRGELHHRTLAELEAAAATDVEVLLLGPSGVGKELYARWIHERSGRSAAKFVPVNCGAVPVSLFENELFGHVGGAYTGAEGSRDGLVADADGGTLFLDEIDTLDIASQVKLLRFLQEREYRRLGESRIRKANVRIVTASNADLLRLVRESRFREDLMFRIHVFPLRIPPLCERSEDILPLLEEYVARCAEAFHRPAISFAPEALRYLQTYSWPGNVRELENCVRYLSSLRLGRAVEATDLKLVHEHPDRSRSAPAGPSGTCSSAVDGCRSLREAKKNLVWTFERNFIVDAMRASRGNIAHAAQASGKTRRAFFELMRKYHVRAEDYR